MHQRIQGAEAVVLHLGSVEAEQAPGFARMRGEDGIVQRTRRGGQQVQGIGIEHQRPAAAEHALE